MNEEPEAEVEVQPEETEVTENTEQPQVEQEEPSNIFDALFSAAEAEPEPEPEEESRAISLNQAIRELDEESTVEEPEEEEEPEAETEEVAQEPEAAKPKTKKKKVKQVVDPDVEPEETPSEYSFPEEDPDKEFTDNLLPEEKDLYELAKFADENMDGYKGKAQEFKKYFEQTKSYIETRIKEDPHADLSDDADYQEFISKNRPDFNQLDIKKVDRERNIHEAMRRIEEQQAPEKERAKVEQERSRKAPEVQKFKMMFRQHSKLAIPEEMSDLVKDEDSIKQFEESNPLEYQIINTVTTELHNTGDALLDITQGMSTYDESNPLHSKLLKWVNDEQEQYIQSGDTNREGKTFMRRERYFKLPESKRTAYYTWSDADLIQILTVRAKQKIQESLEHQRQLLERSGYSRQAVKQAAPKKAPAPKRQPPPSVGSAPRPGNTPAQTPPPARKTALESVLGM
jgi:hypothetical protein